MNLLLHMSFVVVLDYLIFEYWYIFANRYSVLNFHETGFLPGRYIISGLVAGAFVYWIYILPVLLIKRVWKGYWHPRWGLLWAATAGISSIQVMQIVRNADPPLELPVAAALVAHLQVMHLIMFMVADRAIHRNLGAIIPGVRSAVLFMCGWLFWLWYSFQVTPEGSLTPHIGAAWERYLIGLLVLVLVAVGIAFRSGFQIRQFQRGDVVIPALRITIADIIDSFYSAWALFYLVIPVLHYLTRGYVTAHSNLFPLYLPGMLIPVLWSLVVMWIIILVSKSDLTWRQLRATAEHVIDRTGWMTRS